MSPAGELLLAVLKTPESVADLSLRDWSRLIPLARHALVLRRIAHQIEARGLLHQVPSVVQPHLHAAWAETRQDERIIRWEVRQIGRALRGIAGPVVLLKGAAYLSAGLSIAGGRRCRDVDILLPKDQLPEAERALLDHGWQPADLSQRDDRYFRSWLHELPALEHRVRQTLIDVHHSILPSTDALRVDSTELLRAARPLDGGPFFVLCPEDMVIHSAVHLFRNGDFHHGLRDLLDMDGLLREFSAEEDFWTRLVRRVDQFGLREPCFFALSCVSRLYDTPLPAEVQEELIAWRPGNTKAAVLGRLIDRALWPRELDRLQLSRAMAAWLLAHWPLPRWRAMASPLFWTKRF
jgi:hypothetical protein